MRCARVRRIIVLIPAAERRARVHAAVAEHLRLCAACAQYARQMARLEQSFLGSRGSLAPDGFAAAVTERLIHSRRKRRVGWWARLFGGERAAAPLMAPGLAWGAASVAVVAVAIALFVGGPQYLSPGLLPNETVVIPGGSVVSELPAMDEIMLRHHRYSRSDAVMDDPGMNLISYAPDGK